MISTQSMKGKVGRFLIRNTAGMVNDGSSIQIRRLSQGNGQKND